MSGDLAGKRVAFLVANSGVEQAELTTPWQAVEQAGGEPVLLAPEQDTVQAVKDDINPGDEFSPSAAVRDASPEDYDALVLPGGVANPDELRIVPEAVSFVRAIAQAG